MSLQDVLTDDSAQGDDPHRRAIKLRKWIYTFSAVLAGLHFGWLELGSMDLQWVTFALTETALWRAVTVSLALVMALYLLSLGQVAIVFEPLIEGRAFQTKRRAVTELDLKLDELKRRRTLIGLQLPDSSQSSFSGPPSESELQRELDALDLDILDRERELRLLRGRDLVGSAAYLRLERMIELLRLVPPLVGAVALFAWGYLF